VFSIEPLQRGTGPSRGSQRPGGARACSFDAIPTEADRDYLARDFGDNQDAVFLIGKTRYRSF
jgi:hypothetical protein